MDNSRFLKGLLAISLLSLLSFFSIAWSAEGRIGSCVAHDFANTQQFIGSSGDDAGQQYCEANPGCGRVLFYNVDEESGCGGTRWCRYLTPNGVAAGCHYFAMDWVSNDIPDYNNVDPNKQPPCDKPKSPTTTNPCVPANGNKYKPQTDIPASGNAIGFRRSYNSTSMGLGYFGAGWSSSAHKSLTVNGNSIIVRQASGRSEPFAKSNGTWVGDADSKLLISEIPNRYVLTLPNGNIETYSLTGKLTTEVDTNGNEKTYTYNSQNRLETITNNFGHQLNFVYNSIGHVISISDASGAVYRYDYDTKNNLTSVTYPDQTSNTDSDNPQRIYHYEDTNFPHHLTGITDENGVRHQTYAYKATGKVILSEKAVTTSTTGVGQERVKLMYTGNGTTRTITDAAGTDEIWTYTNNLDVQLLTSRINQTDGKGITQTYDASNNMLTHTDEEGRVTSYTYNATNQRTSMTEASGTPQARTTTYEYVNADIDRVTRTTMPSVYGGSIKETVNSYDANLNIISTAINGFTESGQTVSRSTSFTYNSLGQVTQIDGPRTDVNDITAFAYYNCNTGAECGQIQSISNAKGHVTNYNSYDAMGRLLQSTDSNGVVIEYIYHPRGWLLSQTQTSTDGVRTFSYTYDNAGQMISSTSPDGIVITYVYDEAHDLRSITDNLGNKVEYLYDENGNRTETKTFDPDSTLIRQVTMDYDTRNFVKEINNAGSITQLLTDAVGNVASATDPNTNQSQSNYDALDRLQTTVDALTNTSSYQYNVADQLTQVQAPNGATTQFEFDDLGNQLKEISPDRGTSTYTHDAAGNVLVMTDARGITVSYQYDELNRITQITYPDASENISYQYDTCQNGTGRLCQLTDNSGITDYEYDPWGNITKTTKQEIDNTQQGAGAVLGTFVASYQYDAGNRISQMTYPSGRIVNFQRDAIGRIQGMTMQFTNGQATTLLSNRSYRADGLWTSQEFGNGLIHNKVYDQQGRMTSHAAGTYNRNYGFDANGNIIDINGTLNELYNYDPLDRLLKEMDSISSQFIEFSYDENGNRLSENDNAQISNLSYQTNSNRLSSIQGTTLSIDASGRTLIDQFGRNYTYNDAGRIEKIQQSGSVLGEYTYGADQLRTRKVSGGVTTIYHYDLAGNMIAESTHPASPIKDYIYADGERIAVDLEPELAEPINLALGKSASQSSTGFGGLASKGVDGNTNGAFAGGSVTHTLFNAQAWWQVDLGAQADVSSIRVHNRTEAANRLADFHIFISDAPFGNRSLAQLLADPSIDKHYHTGTLSGSSLEVALTSVTGRYVRVQLQGTQYLHLAEVEVMGNEILNNAPSNLALGKPASQSSTGYGGVASRGVDGNTNGAFASGSVTHTLLDAQALWHVDLGLQANITDVRVHNRTEAPARLANFYVLVSEAPFGTRTLAQLLSDSTIERHYHAGTLPGSMLSIPMTNVTGRYVRVQLTGTDYLHLAEVEVIGTEVSTEPENPDLHYYINDHLGTPQRTIDGSQVVTWEAEYEAFGEAVVTTGTIVNNHRFPGQYYDVESGLHYNWNRYYEPKSGRYVTSDPIGLGGGLNTFGYVKGNPLVNYDNNGAISKKLTPSRVKCFKDLYICGKNLEKHRLECQSRCKERNEGREKNGKGKRCSAYLCAIQKCQFIFDNCIAAITGGISFVIKEPEFPEMCPFRLTAI